MTQTARESRTVTTDDGRVLDVLVSGPPGGVTMVFHTGTPCGLTPMPQELDPASSGVRTVMYARPGYNGSTPKPGRTVADAASDTATILDALGIDRFLNIGWSGGGPHAVACSALLGDRCIGTAVMAGLAPYDHPDATAEVRAWYEEDEDNQLALAGDIEGFRKACDVFGEQMLQTTAAGVVANAKSAADREFLSDVYAEWVAAFFRAAFAAGSDGAVGDFLAFFQNWGVPISAAERVVIWHGGEDQNVPPAHGEWLAAHIPGAELRAYPNEGHISIGRYLPEMIDALMKAGKA